MKKAILIPAIVAFFAAGVFAAEGKAPEAKKGRSCADCPMHKQAGGKKCGGMTCPEKMNGARTVSRNIADGVEVTITAKDAETAAKIQELAVVHYSPKAEKCPGCPTTVAGAETKVANIEGGVKVTITGKTPETVKKIQNASANEHGGAKEGKQQAKASKKYACAMKCVVSEKPGKCPKCGMPMEEIR